MTKQEDLILKDIERCKKVQPIMDRLGIEPDGYHVIQTENDYEPIKSSEVHLILSTYQSDLEYANDQISWSKGGTLYEFQEAFNVIATTYRQDKLAEALPKWLKEDESGLDNIVTALRLHGAPACKLELHPLLGKIVGARDSIINCFRFGRGLQAQLEATADLLILLEEKGLLEAKKSAV